MFRYLLIYMACLLFAFSIKAQGISNDTIPKEVLMLDGKPMTEKQIQRYHKHYFNQYLEGKSTKSS